MKRIATWISDQRVALVLLLLISLASGIGTAIPQGYPAQSYRVAYDANPWMGMLSGDKELALQLDHLYTDSWFPAPLACLGLALILCSIRRKWPTLQAAWRWMDYSTPRHLSNLAIAETIPASDSREALNGLARELHSRG